MGEVNYVSKLMELNRDEGRKGLPETTRAVLLSRVADKRLPPSSPTVCAGSTESALHDFHNGLMSGRRCNCAKRVRHWARIIHPQLAEADRDGGPVTLRLEVL